jgi:hypothetical protein
MTTIDKSNVSYGLLVFNCRSTWLLNPSVRRVQVDEVIQRPLSIFGLSYANHTENCATLVTTGSKDQINLISGNEVHMYPV